MRHILVPTDFSDNAYNALSYAVQLFKEDNCRFYLLNTYTPAVYEAQYVLYSPAQVGLADIYMNNSYTGLERMEEKIKREFSNSKHGFERLSAFNILTDEIKASVEKYEIDLIIMGTQGATNTPEILFGTNTIHVIKKANCPVLAVPSNFYFERPKEILFPSDYKVDLTEGQLSTLTHIANISNARINVLHVRDRTELTKEQEANKVHIDKLFEGVSHIFHSVADQDIIEAIETHQVRTKSNLIALVNNKHSFFENILFKPVINQIGFQPKVPLLVIPSKKRTIQ